jgi:methionine synthase II (cobalamin-independent)
MKIKKFALFLGECLKTVTKKGKVITSSVTIYQLLRVGYEQKNEVINSCRKSYQQIVEKKYCGILCHVLS